jgi:XTP/dITP diphosphohydrolase
MREYRQLLREVPFELVSLEDLGITAEVEETGSTFHENACLKARSYAALCRGRFETCSYVLGDDSGLEVDALGGEPGVRSARYGEKSPLTPSDRRSRVSTKSDLFNRGSGGIYSGEGRPGQSSDADRVRLLLSKLEGVPWERRTARFRCVIAIARPWGGTVVVVGSVAGMIQYSPLGNEGFGYDPVFYLPSFQSTMAQLPLEEKNRISHRADAARKAAALLQQIAFCIQPPAKG